MKHMMFLREIVGEPVMSSEDEGERERHFPSPAYNMGMARMKTKFCPLSASEKEMGTFVLRTGKYVSCRNI